MKKPFHSIVTGGVQGIGRAIVEQLLARGDEVTVFDCLPEADAAVAALVTRGAQYLRVDVASASSVEQGFAACSAVDLLVNNAGITRDGLAVRLKESQWDEVLAVNLKGAFLCSQQALKFMMKARSGTIINISSIVGLTGNAGQANYAASKAGLIGLTKSLAREYGKVGVRVNAIAPGFIATRMTDALSDAVKQTILERISLQRFGEAAEVASLVAFLSSGNADYITGEVIAIDGGLQ